MFFWSDIGPALLLLVPCEIGHAEAGAGHLLEPQGPRSEGCLTWRVMSQVHPQQLLNSHKQGPAPQQEGSAHQPSLLFPNCSDQWSFPPTHCPAEPGVKVPHHHLSVNHAASAPAAMCAGDRKTLITHLTAEERLFLARRDHPPANETREELSRSNVLWLPGDTIESAAVNGNPLVRVAAITLR